MRLQVGRVDHDRLVLGPLGGQARHDPGEDAIVAPTLPAVVERSLIAALSSVGS